MMDNTNMAKAKKTKGAKLFPDELIDQLLVQV